MTTALHFVGFWDQDVATVMVFDRAVRLFGKPDFVHRHWDHRATGDVAPDDVVVFGTQREWERFTNNQPAEFAFNDSEVF